MSAGRVPVEAWIIINTVGEYVVASDEETASELAGREYGESTFAIGRNRRAAELTTTARRVGEHGRDRGVIAANEAVRHAPGALPDGVLPAVG
jgi:hypothetical protein